jgi:hypothetical protein
MKKNPTATAARTYNSNIKQQAIPTHPPAAKPKHGVEDYGATGATRKRQSPKELVSESPSIADGYAPTPLPAEDRRKTARREHTNHFTNRADSNGK